MFKLILTAIIAFLLIGCSPMVLITDSRLVQRAISRQISLSEEKIGGLYSPQNADASTIRVHGIRITQVESLMIENLPSLRSRGNYDLQRKRRGQRLIQKQKPFDLYLQSQKQGLTWRLARPLGRGEWGTWGLAL
jgi:hypothetical protein